MRIFKRAAALAAVLAVCLSLLAGCGKQEDGLTFGVCVGAQPRTFDPIYAVTPGDQTILAHLYENLMRLREDINGQTTMDYGMAKSVSKEENHDGTVTWTFKLRSARWSDGRSVTADDFVYAWRRLADPASASPYASILTPVVGYEAVRETGDTSLLQVSAKNDSTFVVVLNGTYDWFLSEICTAPATSPLREDVVSSLRDAAVERNRTAEADGGQGTERWWSDPTRLVTNGPYRAQQYNDALTLTTSARYHSTHTGPQQLVFRFADTAREAQELYDQGAVDLIWPLPEETLAAMAADENWTPTPVLGTYTVLLNCAQSVFSDVLVRQALTLAIDRNAIAALAGPLARPAEGLVPPGVPQDEAGDFRTYGGALLDNDPALYEQRCQQARELLSNAGYDRGSDLGTLEYLYLEDGTSDAVAQELARQWKDVLGVEIQPVAVPTERELRAALRDGSYTLAGLTIQAVGNDAECFLMQWTSHNRDNSMHYENTAYDTLLSIIATADGVARMGCMHDAEVLVLEDHAVAPLYTTGTAWTLRDGYAGLVRDERGWFLLSNVGKWTP